MFFFFFLPPPLGLLLPECRTPPFYLASCRVYWSGGTLIQFVCMFVPHLLNLCLSISHNYHLMFIKTGLSKNAMSPCSIHCLSRGQGWLVLILIWYSTSSLLFLFCFVLVLFSGIYGYITVFFSSSFSFSILHQIYSSTFVFPLIFGIIYVIPGCLLFIYGYMQL